MCAELGLTFHENQKTYKWYGTWVNDFHGQDAAYRHGIKTEDYGKCEHAISVPGSQYQIGLHKNPNGPGLVPVFDFYGSGHNIQALLGGGGEKLKQVYGVHAATRAAKKKGWFVTRTPIKNNGIKLTIRGM